MKAGFFLYRASILALLVCPFSSAATPPSKIVLHYDLIRNGSVVGSVNDSIEHDGKTYTLSSQTRGRGLFSVLGLVMARSSRGNVTGRGLQPVEFRDKRIGKDEMRARLDYSGRTVVTENDGKSETRPMPEAPQDELSMMYSFAFAPPVGAEIRVTRVNGRGVTPFVFVVVGVETIATPAGEMRTLHLSKQRDGPDDKSMDIWFSVDRDYLPARVLEVEKDGARNDMLLTRIEQ